MGLQPRDWSAPCAWCGHKTFALNLVCNRRRCRLLEEKYKVRRDGVLPPDPSRARGNAGGPGDGAVVSTATGSRPGAASRDGEERGFPVETASSLGCSSPSMTDRSAS